MNEKCDSKQTNFEHTIFYSESKKTKTKIVFWHESPKGHLGEFLDISYDQNFTKFALSSFFRALIT